MESTAEPWLPPVPDELPRGTDPDPRCGNCGHKPDDHDMSQLETPWMPCCVDGCVCREYEDPEDE